MRIASTAKAFSGAVALSLVSKGKLALNDTIGERLPKLPKSWHEITLRQLLNHTSGLPDFSKSPRFRKALQASLKKPPPAEKLLSYIKDKDPLFDPGSRYHYSNSDNIAVGLMVESATNRTYESQLQEQVYGLLDLKKDHPAEGTEPERALHPRLRQRPLGAAPRGPKRVDSRRLGLGVRRHSIHASRPQRLHPRIRRWRPLRPVDPRPTTPASSRRRTLRTPRSRKELGRPCRLPLRD
jgi:CubicO group peptidase (beta-lactamase class C family)